jgi:hypothetical protein
MLRSNTANLRFNSLTSSFAGSNLIYNGTSLGRAISIKSPFNSRTDLILLNEMAPDEHNIIYLELKWCLVIDD